MECFECYGTHHIVCPSCGGRGSRPLVFTCPACGKTYSGGRFIYERPVRHHWFDPEGYLHEVFICNLCNHTLDKRCSIALGDHIFPSWEAQVDYIRRQQTVCLEPLEPRLPTEQECEKQLLLFRSWLGREHTAREVQGYGMSEEELIEMVKRWVAELESRLVAEETKQFAEVK